MTKQPNLFPRNWTQTLAIDPQPTITTNATIITSVKNVAAQKQRQVIFSDYRPKKKKQAFKMSKLYHNHITSDETRARLSAITSKK